MSPELQTVEARAVVVSTIGAAVRRARRLALLEAVAWALAAASLSTSLVAAALVGAIVVAWRWRESRRSTIVRAIERAFPVSRNLFITAEELDTGRLTTTDAVRARVFADAAAVARDVDPRAVVPVRRVVVAGGVAAMAIAIVAAGPRWPRRLSNAAAIVRSRTGPPAASVGGRLRITATIQPPAYTGLAGTTAVDPEQLRAVEGSVLTVAVDAEGDRITATHDGASAVLQRGGDRRFSYRAPLTKTGFLIVSAGEGASRTIPIVVSPDALPAVRLTAPGRDLVYGGGNPRIAFDARATDDYGLRSLALRYTKVSGSGENFEFQDGEIPLEVTEASRREWTGRATRSIAALGLKDGDMLVYRAVAADARPGDGSGSSDAFFIEISRRGVAAGDAFTLPEEETRYALSQQMLIVKTERLHQRRAALAPTELTEAALNLAVEQRMIRAEFVFMLGGEVEDEEVEARRSTELQEGRLENRGQRDLRAATIAMSQAEKLLTGANTGDALVAERAAVAALQRAFARGRYILRAFAARSQLDPARRLTGSLAGATEWRRGVTDVPPNRRAALLQDLLRGIADASTPSAAVGSRARVLAEEAIRIDPASDALRQTATELQHAADAADPGTRARALTNAGAAAGAEARRAHADAPTTAPPPAAALAGAFADAVAQARGRAPREDRTQR